MTVLMNVYYDNVGDIKAITPSEDPGLSAEYLFAPIPIAEVELFLLGQRNPYDFYVSKTKANGVEKFKITKKETKVDLTRSLDNFLTKVSDKEVANSILRIIAMPNKKTIRLQVDPEFVKLLTSGDDDERSEVEKFIQQGNSILYFTRYNNPFHHLYSLHFNPRILFQSGELLVSYNEKIDLFNSSVYTKKLLKSYTYKIEG